jgi:hypothetical protein
MTYSVSTTSGSTSYSVVDGQVNTELDVNLVGKGYVGYGNYLNQNIVHMLENFADSSSPGKPITGQLWYDTSTANLKVFDGASFTRVTPDVTQIDSSTIGNLLISSSSIVGQTTNGNVEIQPNNFGVVNIKRAAILGTTPLRVLFTAANGLVSTNSMTYAPTTDTLGVTNISATSITGTLATAAQPTITSVGSLTSLTTAGAITAGGEIYATAGLHGNVGGRFNGTVGAVTPNSGVFTTLTATTGYQGNVNGAVNGTVGATTPNTGAFTSVTTSSTIASTGIIYAIGGLQGTHSGAHNGTVGATTPNTGAFTSISFSSNVSAAASIIPTVSNTHDIGSTSFKFRNIYGVASQATYADLAENYVADKQYSPGTVVEFGGEFEVTEAAANSRRIAGVVSTNPAYLMNSDATGEFVVPVALQGRVPCKVLGPVEKGDMLISAGTGYAIVNNDPKVGSVIGKALEATTSLRTTIEIVVGRC